MSRWEEQLNNHQIHSTLEELSSYIDTNFDDIDETEIIEKRRLLKVFSIIKEILENIISLGMMDKYTKITNECECNKRSGKNESI